MEKLLWSWAGHRLHYGACWIPKATETHRGCVIPIASPLQHTYATLPVPVSLFQLHILMVYDLNTVDQLSIIFLATAERERYMQQYGGCAKPLKCLKNTRK